jgi:hypothetical protein
VNPFLLVADEQIAHWKALREEISHMDDEAALKRVAEYWAQAPLMKCAYDGEDCSEWPSAWEMIHNGDWCPYSVAIGMEATLRLSGWEPSRLILKTIRDYDISDERTVLIIDGKVVLNYSVGMVEEYPRTRHDVLATFQHDGKRYLGVAK